MKQRWICLAIGALAASLSVSADSIRYGGVLYEDVYVGISRQFYFVHFPEEGRVEKVSRARKDVDAPEIDADDTVREALRERFEARKAERMEALSTVVDAPPIEVDTEGYLHRKALQATGLFEAQLDHWNDLSPTQQQLVLQEVLALSASNANQRANEQETIQSRLEGLKEAKVKRESALESARSKRTRAVDAVEQRNLSDVYWRMHEREVIGYQQGNSAYLDDFWLHEAGTEEAVAARRIAKVDQTYAKEAAGHAQVLGRVESAITQREREAIATAGKAKDAQRRYGAYLARIDELIGASQGDYSRMTGFEPLASWSGDSDRQTPSVIIDRAVWRLDCQRDDFGLDGNFKITVVDAETDTPFTAITGKDFLHMRTLLIDRPGEYYFIVKQDYHRIPYELRVSAVTEHR